MAGKVDLYNLGTQGVDLTRSSIHADDGSLRTAQNARPDTRGETGGLAKRDGLTAINSSTAGGSVLGALHVPLPGTKTNYLASISAPYNFLQWLKSTDSFATVTEVVDSTAAVYKRLRSSTGQAGDGLGGLLENDVTPTQQDVWYGKPTCIWKSKLIFASRSPDLASIPITIFDGTIFREISTLPFNPDVGAVSKSMVSLLAEGDYVYIAAWDSGTDSSNHKGSVYRLDPVRGQWTQLGATFPTGYVPSALCWYQGKLWAGTYSENKAGSGRVYWIRPGIDSAWTLDHTTTAGQGEILDLAVYKGELYAATRGSSGVAALVKKRTTTGTWSTSLTAASTARDQYYLSLCVFGSNLYASYVDQSNATGRISKFDGSSWSTVQDSAAALRYWQLFQDGATIYAVDIRDSLATADKLLLTSTNGTSWTDRTTVLSTSTSTSLLAPAFGVIFN